MALARASYRIRLHPSVPPDETKTEVVPSLKATPTQRLLQSPGTGVRLVRDFERQMRRQDQMSSSTLLQGWAAAALDRAESLLEATWLEWTRSFRGALRFTVLLAIPGAGWLGLLLVAAAAMQRLLLSTLGAEDGVGQVSARELRSILRAIQRSGNETTRRLLRQELLNWSVRVRSAPTSRARGGVRFTEDAEQLLHELRLALDRVMPVDRHAIRELTRALEAVVRARVDLERARASCALQRDAASRARWNGRSSLERRFEAAALEPEYQSYARKVFEIILGLEEKQARGWSFLPMEPASPPT